MRVSLRDVIGNLSPMLRYAHHADGPGAEREVSIGAVSAQGPAPGGVNLTYDCPPDGYNGFDRRFGSFCDATPDTQLWIAVTRGTGAGRRLLSVRVLLSGKPFTPPTVAAPPFGTAVFDFEAGGGVRLPAEPGANAGLDVCPDAARDAEADCTLPRGPSLQLNLTETSTGYFGVPPLPGGKVPSAWYQRDADKLLRLGPTPDGAGGLSDYYFNESGFFLHTTPLPGTGGQASCQWVPSCGYVCEVYNYDDRFMDYLGTWDVSWKRDVDEYNVSHTRAVHAYAGNAIDAAGVFPVIAYMTAGGAASYYCGLDKVTPNITQNPDYAYYWYTGVNATPPDPALFDPPPECAPSATAAPPAVPGGGARPPRFTVDLDRAPEERWAEVAAAYRPALVQLAAQQRATLAPLQPWADRIAAAQREPDEYVREMRGVVAAVNDSRVTLHDLRLANIQYELTADCTGIVAAAPGGGVVHGRNLDFDSPGMAAITLDVDFARGGRVVYSAATFAGYVGVHTGVRKGAWSLSQNTRIVADERRNRTLFLHRTLLAAEGGARSFGILVRELMDAGVGYDDMVARLSGTPLAAPQYFIVAGAGAGQGAVITRDRAGAVRPWALDPAAGRWSLVETNYDHWEPPPPGDDRRDPAAAAIAAGGRAAVSADAVLRVLSTPPVLNNATVISWTAVPATGEHQTIVRTNLAE